MPKQIIWSPLSENDFISILDYVKENWDDMVVQGFIAPLHLTAAKPNAGGFCGLL